MHILCSALEQFYDYDLFHHVEINCFVTMTMKLHTRRYKYKVVSSACSSKEGMYMMWLWWRYSTYADINIRGCLLMRFENIGIDIEAEAHADERMQ